LVCKIIEVYLSIMGSSWHAKAIGSKHFLVTWINLME
jgi:hypothetical protein